jgi:hypothetical protein
VQNFKHAKFLETSRNIKHGCIAVIQLYYNALISYSFICLFSYAFFNDTLSLCIVSNGCPPQTPRAARTRTRAAAVGSQRLTAELRHGQSYALLLQPTYPVVWYHHRRRLNGHCPLSTAEIMSIQFLRLTLSSGKRLRETGNVYGSIGKNVICVCV